MTENPIEVAVQLLIRCKSVSAMDEAVYRVAQLRTRGINAILRIRPRKDSPHRYEVIVVEGNAVKTCTTRQYKTGLRCLKLRDHVERHKFGLEMPGWKEELMSKIDAEDGAKIVQALVRTFKNTDIDQDEVLDAPAKLWERFKLESRDLGLDLKQIAERVRRGK